MKKPPAPIKSANTVSPDIHIDIRKSFDDFPVEPLLKQVFTAWEMGKSGEVVNGDGSRNVTCDKAFFDEAYGKVRAHMCKFAAAFLEEVLPQVGPVLFAEGFKRGLEDCQRPGLVPGKPSALMDSEAIVKTIAEEMQKMFVQGLEQGKAHVDNSKQSPPLEMPHKCADGSTSVVQRDSEGRITGVVQKFIYDEKKADEALLVAKALISR